MFETIIVERKAQVGTIWMNRPDVHNALNPLLIAELTTAFQRFDRDENLRVVVLAGKGRSFSAGADIASMRAAGAASFDQNLADALALAAMFKTLAEMKKPTIARVQGSAIGGGVGLACACDIGVAADGAVFATSEVRLGLIPSVIGPYVLGAIGARQARRLFLTGERISAKRAQDLGIVQEVTSRETLDDTISGIAADLVSGGPEAQAAVKLLISRTLGHGPSPELIAATAHGIAALRATDEAREGLSAFLSKRAPRWQVKN